MPEDYLGGDAYAHISWRLETAHGKKALQKQDRLPGAFLFSNKYEKFPAPKTVPEENREEWEAVFHRKLPALLRQAAYKKAFYPIFARIVGKEKVSKKF